MIQRKPSGSERHDQYFKHSFGHKEVVSDFLKGRLPQALLEKQPDTFLGNNVRHKRLADLIWSVRTKRGKEVFLFIHFEGEAKSTKMMALRLLEYQTTIIRKFLEEGHEQCPAILSFVLFYGSGAWKHARSIAELFKDFGLYLKYGLKRNFVIELAQEEKENLKKDGKAFCPELIKNAP